MTSLGGLYRLLTPHETFLLRDEMRPGRSRLSLQTKHSLKLSVSVVLKNWLTVDNLFRLQLRQHLTAG
jgi:hypothetical protein